MRNYFGLFLVFLLSTTLFGCGQGSGSAVGSSGSAKLIVHNSKSRDASKDYGSIMIYRVTVSGDGISEAIEAEFSGDAESGVVDGIPSGGNREVVVTAINRNDKIIRQGESSGVSVSPGKVSEVDVKMDAVPIFANLFDGNVVKSTRLRFELFTDPEDSLLVEEVGDESSIALLDVVTNSGEVYPDISSGIALMVPPNISPGEHSFRVSSNETGRSSVVKIKIIDGNDIGPAPLYSGGLFGVNGDYLSMSRAGMPIYVSANSGAAWAAVLGQLLTKFDGR